jgi:hypothetical protein
MASMDILEITDQPLIDESIDRYEYYPHSPVQGSKLNGVTTFKIDDQGAYLYSGDSYLLFNGQLTKSDAASNPYGVDDLVTLTNNAMMYLYASITHKFGEQLTEILNHPGRATTMLGASKYRDDFNKTTGLNRCWAMDTSSTADDNNLSFKTRRKSRKKSDPRGTFAFYVPLKHIFGFCDDCTKVMSGLKHLLVLVRGETDSDAIFRAAGADAGKVTLSNITWFVPHIKMSLLK